MKKTLLGLTAIILFFTACTKDNATAEEWYLSKVIDVYGDRKDTGLVSYHADNTLKEFYYTYVYNGQPGFNAFAPQYEGGKIVGINMRNLARPNPHVISSFVYAGNIVTHAVDQVWDQDEAAWVVNSRDSLVHVAGKLSELYENYRNGSTTFYKLTWEGDNVKRCEVSSKQQGGDYQLYQEINYTYGDKPGYQQLLNDNYYWLSDVTSFEFLSANNLVKREILRKPEGTMEVTTTYTFTYADGMLKEMNSHVESVYADPQDYKTILEYTKR